jgi:hypothetical protein
MLRKLHTLSKLLRNVLDETREPLSDFSSPHVTDVPARGQHLLNGQRVIGLRQVDSLFSSGPLFSGELQVI